MPVISGRSGAPVRGAGRGWFGWSFRRLHSVLALKHNDLWRRDVRLTIRATRIRAAQAILAAFSPVAVNVDATTAGDVKGQGHGALLNAVKKLSRRNTGCKWLCISVGKTHPELNAIEEA